MTDGVEPEVQDSLQYVVTNAPAVIGASDGQQIGESTQYDLTFDFTDPGTADTHTATIDWGDDTPASAGVVVEADGSGTVSGTHIYETNGIYFIQVSVEDNDGAVGTESIRSIVAGLGDLTRNGFVDFQDLTILLANWNQDVTVRQGNLVEPQTTPVNFADLTVLLANWTGPGPAGAPQAPQAAAMGSPAQHDPHRIATTEVFDRLGRAEAHRTIARTANRHSVRRATLGRHESPLRRLQAAAADRAIADDTADLAGRREMIAARRAERGGH